MVRVINLEEASIAYSRSYHANSHRSDSPSPDAHQFNQNRGLSLSKDQCEINNTQCILLLEMARTGLVALLIVVCAAPSFWLGADRSSLGRYKLSVPVQAKAQSTCDRKSTLLYSLPLFLALSLLLLPAVEAACAITPDAYGNVVVPDGTTTIADRAFNGCSGLKSISLPASLNLISYMAFSGSGLTSLAVPDSVTSIGYGAFELCASLSSVTFGSGSQLTTIGGSVFGSSGLTSFAIPDTITSLGEGAFIGCANLTSVTFGSASQLTYIDRWAFGDSGLTSFAMPDGVTSIGDESFRYCTSLTSLTFGGGSQLTSIGRTAFIRIGITSVAIPNSLTSIGAGAFAYSTSLTSVTFGKGSKLTTIGQSAFIQSDLKSFAVPDTVTSIDMEAFSGCTSLTSVTFGIGSQLTSIGAWAFTMSGINSFAVPDAVTTIGFRAFQSCAFLTSVTFGSESRVNFIGESAFHQSVLTSITIPDVVTTIDYRAFAECVSLTSVTFGSGSKLTTIGDAAFGQSGLTSIAIPDTVTSIGTGAFQFCPLTSVSFGSGSRLISVHDRAFQSTFLTTIKLPPSVALVGPNAFPFCEGAACIMCNLGYYHNDGYQCVTCAPNTYADRSTLPSLAECIACPTGQVCTAKGCTSASQCSDPKINFITGYLICALVVVFSVTYLVRGRFQRVAFVRRARIAVGMAKDIRKICTQMSYYGLRSNAERVRDYSSRLIKAWAFIFLSIGGFLLLGCLLFAISLGSIFFKSMILWKGVNLHIRFDFIVYMKNAVAHLASYLAIPGFQYLFYPIERLYYFVSNFKIDLSAIKITCKGASAPMELLVNVVIIGICIVIVESNFQLLRMLSFNGMTDCFISAITRPEYKQWVYTGGGKVPEASLLGKLRYIGVILLVIFTRLAGGFDVFVSSMQFLMSLTKISAFAEVNFMHAFSAECNNAAGYTNFDYYIASIASVEAWLLLAPALYEISKIVIPGVPQWALEVKRANEARDPESSWLHFTKYFSMLSPDLWLCMCAASWIRFVAVFTPSHLKNDNNEREGEKEGEGNDEGAGAGGFSAKTSTTRSIRYVKYKIMVAAGIDIRQSPSHDAAVAKVTRVLAGEIVETCTDFPLKKICTRSGAEESWMQIVYPQDGWVPLITADGKKVLELAAAATEQDSDNTRTSLRTSSPTLLRPSERLDLLEAGSSSPTGGNSRLSRSLRYEGDVESMLRIQSQGEKAGYAFRIVLSPRSMCGPGGLETGVYFASPGYSVHIWEAADDTRAVDNAFYLYVIDRASGRVDSAYPYDVNSDGKHTGGRRARHLVHDLNALTDDKLVLVFTTGKAVSEKRLKYGLPEALERCGASSNFKGGAVRDDSCYALIGIPGAGPNSGYEWVQKEGTARHLDLQFCLEESGWTILSVENCPPESPWWCSGSSYIRTALRIRTEPENKHWQEKVAVTQPSYYELCKAEYAEIADFMYSKCGFYRFSVVALAAVMLCFGHVLTSVGRQAAYLVAWKYWKFVQLCLGYWSEDVVDLYRIQESVREMSVVWSKPFLRKNNEAYATYREANRGLFNSQSAHAGPIDFDKIGACFNALPAWMSPEGGWYQKQKGHRDESAEMSELQQVGLKRELSANYCTTLYALVATRAVLLQVIPSLTFLSIFASTMSASPVLVYSKRLSDSLPELIVSEPYALARAQQQEIIDEEEWIRRAHLTVDQNCVANPKTRKTWRGEVVPVPNKVRGRIEKANEKAKEHMREVLAMPSRTVDEWIVAINGTILYVTESRLMDFLVNLFKFIITIGLLYVDPAHQKYLMGAACVVLLPHCFLLAAGAVAVVGSSLCITDDDLEKALSSIGLGILFQAVLSCTGSTKKRRTSKSADTARAREGDDLSTQSARAAAAAEIEMPEMPVPAASLSMVEVRDSSAAKPSSELEGYTSISAKDEHSDGARQFDTDLPPQYDQDHYEEEEDGDGSDVRSQSGESDDHWKWSGAHDSEIDEPPPPYI